MTRRHIAWLIGIFVIGLVLATRNAPLRHAAPPGFMLLPSTLPGPPRPVAGPVAPGESLRPIWFSPTLEIDRMCYEGNYGCDPGICPLPLPKDCTLPFSAAPLHPQPVVGIRTFRGTREEAQRRGLLGKQPRPVAGPGGEK